MEHTKKLAVIPQDLLEALHYNQKQQMGPRGEQLLNIDREMKTILERSDLPEDQKVLMYSAALGQYQQVKHQSKSIFPVLQPKTSTIPLTDWESQVESFLPASHRRKGVQVLKWIRQNTPELQWNDKGEVEGLPQSNILDLIDDVTRPKARSKDRVPLGIQDFVTKLRASNIPTSLLGNAHYLKRHESVQPSVEPLTPPSEERGRRRTRTPYTTPLYTTPTGNVKRVRSKSSRRLKWMET